MWAGLVSVSSRSRKSFAEADPGAQVIPESLLSPVNICSVSVGRIDWLGKLPLVASQGRTAGKQQTAARFLALGQWPDWPTSGNRGYSPALLPLTLSPERRHQHSEPTPDYSSSSPGQIDGSHERYLSASFFVVYLRSVAIRAALQATMYPSRLCQLTIIP